MATSKNEPAPPQVNAHGTNVAIAFHVLDDESMAKLGLRLIGGTWNYSRTRDIYAKGARSPLTIDFWLRYDPKADDLAIHVLDDDFCQPFDYQRMEATGTVNEYTQGTRSFVEEQMAYLQDAGVLSGHAVGDYV